MAHPVNKPVLVIQLVLLLVCAYLVWGFASRFPYPSPVIHSWLTPKQRWPAPQISAWVLADQVDPKFLEFFYRDPDRKVPPGDNVVAPADGVVNQISTHDGVQYIVIALSYWDVHVQRHPAAGTVVEVLDQGDTWMDGEGRNMVFLRDKVSPVQKVVIYDTAWGRVGLRLITSLMARRIEVWSKVGAKAGKGERMGRILLGSTVVLELPAGVPLRIRVGQRVVAGETVIAERGASQ